MTPGTVSPINSIRADRRYQAVYSALPFSSHMPFLRKLRARYPTISIPFLDVAGISEEARATFDSYIYIPSNADTRDILARLHASFPHAEFLGLGVMPGADILSMFRASVTEVDVAVVEGEYYKVRTGPHRNIPVHLIERMAGDIARVEFTVMRRTRSLEVAYANLVPCPPPTDPFAAFSNLLRDSHDKRAIIIDGERELADAGFAYQCWRSRRDDRFIGSSMGCYFTFLKFREFYPEYEVHVVFGPRGADPHASAALVGAQDRNREWVKQFAIAAGFHLYHFTDHSELDVIGSLARTMTGRLNYAHVIVATKLVTFYQLVSHDVSLSLLKSNFRDYFQTVTLADALRRFGLSGPAMISRINWVRALSGDMAAVPSINMFNKQAAGNLSTRIWPVDYLPHIEVAADLADLKLRLLRHADYHPFLMSGQFDRNLAALTLDLTLFDGVDDLDAYCHADRGGNGIVDRHAVQDLLASNSFFKELEMVDKNIRIIAGLW